MCVVPLSRRDLGATDAMATLPKPKSLSLQAIRAESRNRDLEEKIRQENKRNTLVLILRFLTDNR